MRSVIILTGLLCCFMLTSRPLPGQTSEDPASDEAVNTVIQIYKTVSGDSKTAVDWEKLRSFFIEEAIIVLKTSREGSTQFSVEEFIQDFKNFYDNPAVSESGFKEEVVRINAQVYGNAAAIGVVYEASVLNSESPPQKGIDFWLLSRKENSWKVLGVSNEIIAPGEPIPEIFEAHEP